VVVDLCQYNESFDVSTLWAAHGPVTLDRWTIDPAAGRVTQQRLDDRGQEFPRVDDRIISRLHRYGYSAATGEVNRAITAAGDFGDDAFSNALIKHDLQRGSNEAREFGRDATVGEAVFAPSSAHAAEDDGYVMAFVHNPERGSSDLVILASQDFTGDPVATIQLPARIPLGFHGSWIPDS
jgi:carotenoid cleavage dioxygenase